MLELSEVSVYVLLELLEPDGELEILLDTVVQDDVPVSDRSNT